jgi:hypothetical protein
MPSLEVVGIKKMKARKLKEKHILGLSLGSIFGHLWWVLSWKQGQKSRNRPDSRAGFVVGIGGCSLGAVFMSQS